MTHEPPAFGAQWWDEHYRDATARDDTAESIGAPRPRLINEVQDLRPGAALDAGCGTGADAIWLAGQGWQVTAVDISPTAVDRARVAAGREAAQTAERITWVVADVSTWDPPRHYDLVLSQYVHPNIPFGMFVGRLAQAVAPGGTLFVAGHHHTDSHSAGHAPAPASIGTDAVTTALDPAEWDVQRAEVSSQAVSHDDRHMSTTDVVVVAHRRS